ncbi:MAG TPA: hypothetical protein VIQ79_05850, partial [Kribbella sp.]
MSRGRTSATTAATAARFAAGSISPGPGAQDRTLGRTISRGVPDAGALDDGPLGDGVLGVPADELVPDGTDVPLACPPDDALQPASTPTPASNNP